MAYTKTIWTDRQVTNPLRFSFTLISGTAGATGSVYDLIPNEGTISNAGTAINATNLNNIENGIFNLDAQVTTNTSNIATLTSGKVAKNGDIMTGTLTAPQLNTPTLVSTGTLNVSGTSTLSAVTCTQLNATGAGGLQEAGVQLTSKYLQLSGGTMTGQLTLNTSGTAIPFRVADTGGNIVNLITTQLGDSTGIGVALQSGGKMVIGSGESASLVMNDASTGTAQTEQMYVTSDQDVRIWSNVQTGVSAKHELKYDASGKLTSDGDVIYEPTPAWTSITLTGGATVNNSRTPRYTKRNGVVYVQGEIATVADGTVIGTLPAGYRHNNGTGMNFICAIANGGATTINALVSVGSNGQITVINKTSGNGSPICFNNIQFPADQ